MITKIQNDKVSIEVNSIGAELWSLKKSGDDLEYLWQGDGTYWTGRSPVLFPNVGAVKGNKMKVDGVEYPLGNHGFPRKAEFELIEGTETKLVYSYKSNDESLKMYPFRFELILSYSLNDKGVSIDYTVKNLDTKEIYFQLGTHPGFNCPLDSELKFDDYYIEFNKSEDSRRLFFDQDNLTITNKDEDGLNGNKMPLKHETFYEGAAIFKDINSNEIALKSDKGSRFVKLSFNKFPALGVWQKPDAPYICLEPWHGISDDDNYTGDFKDKSMIITLDKAKEYNCEMTIEI
ncbi:MAG: aldose 1-epimerase family protein [Spirochaetaceae bacterium]